MTTKQIEKEVKIMHEYGQKLLNDPKKADEFFVQVGIYNKKGQLTKEYGGKDE